MAHNSSRVNMQGPRVATVLDVILRSEGGLQTPTVAKLVDLPVDVTRRTLVAMKGLGMISLVGASGSAYWCRHSIVADVAAQVREDRLTRRRARARTYHKSRRDAGILTSDGRSLEVPDVPFIHRIVQTWPPLRKPPGPASVFHFGGVL